MSTIQAQRQRYVALLTTKPSSTPPTAPSPLSSPSPTSPTDAMGRHPPVLSSSSASTSSSSSRTATRERQAHAAVLGCAATPEAIAAAELQAAQRLDPRVTTADFERATDRARRATQLQPLSQHVLSGFTRVIDAKLSLTPQLVSALCIAVGAPDQLLAAIDQGPGQGAIVWPHPTNGVELVASLVRQLALGGGASMQLQLDPDEAHFLEGVLATEAVPVKEAMGGAGAFAANLLSALPAVRPRFFSSEPLPQRIAAGFAERVEVVDQTGAKTAPTRHSAAVPARVNFSCEYSGGAPLTILGRDHVKLNGVSTALAIGGSGRVILGTRAKDVVPGFDGATDTALRHIATDTDTAFLVGTHYLTQGSPAEAEARATALGRSLALMKQQHPSLLRHHQYVLPKQANNEAVVMAALKGAWDSLSMNAVEVPALVQRLRMAGLTTLGAGVTGGPGAARDAAEEPAAMLEGALAIADALDLPRVHLHGLYGDLIVVNDTATDGPGGTDGLIGGVDVDRTRLALLRARQLASMKAANDSGEIKGPNDLFDVVPTVQGRCLAAVQRFGDAVASHFGVSAAQRAAVVADWHWQDPHSTRQVFFVPSRGIHDRTGGTVSLGDTIDVSALVLARTHGRPKSHPRLQS